jgi:hypothetical protein
MKKYSLNNIKLLELKNGNLKIEYIDGVKISINNVDEIAFELNLTNDNDQPLIDHCI